MGKLLTDSSDIRCLAVKCVTFSQGKDLKELKDLLEIPKMSMSICWMIVPQIEMQWSHWTKLVEWKAVMQEVRRKTRLWQWAESTSVLGLLQTATWAQRWSPKFSCYRDWDKRWEFVTLMSTWHCWEYLFLILQSVVLTISRYKLGILYGNVSLN